MIIANGTIEIKEATEATLDPATGYPVTEQEDAWGAPVPCQYVALSQNRIGMVDEEHYTLASYEIFVEDAFSSSGSGRIRLSDLDGTQVGEFSVKQIVPLDAVCEVKLIV